MKLKHFRIINSISAFILVSLTIIARAQTPINNTLIKPISTPTINSPIYQLFPTKNIWTFIKLDSRNGKMWQVQFDLTGENRGEKILNSIPLVTEENEIKGRFTLYPSENIYNFLLLDQIDGNVYQVQWSMEEKNRGVIPIN